jgi:hypothetical protein
VTERIKASVLASQVLLSLGAETISEIYRNRIRTLRTRRYELRAPGHGASVEVLHTLLGIELRMGKRRVHCPDLATARYLLVFARLGCQEIAVPYDITRIALLAHDLETSWHRMLALASSVSQGRGRNFQRKLERILISRLLEELTEIGAGPDRPEFVQETRQRRRK